MQKEDLDFYQILPKGLVLYIKLTPKSSLKKITGIFIDEKKKNYLMIKILQAPENGKANKELLQFLAYFLNVKQSGIILQTGETSRYKKIFITTENADLLVKKIKETPALKDLESAKK